VYLVRASFNYVPRKLRKPMAADLTLIHRAAAVAKAEEHLEALARKWAPYPYVSQIWAAELEAHQAVLQLFAANPQGDLHNQ